MKANSLKKAVVVTTIIVLACLALRFPARSAMAGAPAPTVQYLVVEAPNGRAAKQAVLDKYGQQGWQLVALDFAHEESFIFRR